MLKTLIESQQNRTRTTSARWGAASVVTHGVLIAGAIAATAVKTPPLVANEAPRKITFVTLEPRQAPAHAMVSTTSTISFTRPSVPPVLLEFREFNCDPGVSYSIDSLFNTVTGDSLAGVTTTSGAPGAGVYDAEAVDRAVRPFSNNPEPVYPAQLRAAGIEGAVVARFVVDTLGRVEAASIDVVSSTQSTFADAVRSALLRSRFVPAQVGGANVRQLVERRFSFALER